MEDRVVRFLTAYAEVLRHDLSHPVSLPTTALYCQAKRVSLPLQ